jgi:aromatic ring-opening dioxygenase LigB subunit
MPHYIDFAMPPHFLAISFAISAAAEADTLILIISPHFFDIDDRYAIDYAD